MTPATDLALLCWRRSLSTHPRTGKAKGRGAAVHLECRQHRVEGHHRPAAQEHKMPLACEIVPMRLAALFCTMSMMKGVLAMPTIMMMVMAMADIILTIMARQAVVTARFRTHL